MARILAGSRASSIILRLSCRGGIFVDLNAGFEKATRLIQMKRNSLAHISALTLNNCLTSYDYDDTYPGSNGTNSACIEGSFYCALVGNFKVTFTATISGGSFDGKPVFAVFSPSRLLKKCPAWL